MCRACHNSEYQDMHGKKKGRRGRSKYTAEKITIDGHRFDSKKEAGRYEELKFMEKAGEIHSLELQKKFVLLPSQRGQDGKVMEEPGGKPYRQGSVYRVE